MTKLLPIVIPYIGLPLLSITLKYLFNKERVTYFLPINKVFSRRRDL